MSGFDEPKKSQTLQIVLVFHTFLGSWVGLDQTWHMSFMTGQDRTPEFAGQVLPDRTESGLIFLMVY